jgi:hypothetical protein
MLQAPIKGAFTPEDIAWSCRMESVRKDVGKTTIPLPIYFLTVVDLLYLMYMSWCLSFRMFFWPPENSLSYLEDVCTVSQL